LIRYDFKNISENKLMSNDMSNLAYRKLFKGIRIAE